MAHEKSHKRFFWEEQYNETILEPDEVRLGVRIKALEATLDQSDGWDNGEVNQLLGRGAGSFNLQKSFYPDWHRGPCDRVRGPEITTETWTWSRVGAPL
jgi:hypothetical protein